MENRSLLLHVLCNTEYIKCSANFNVLDYIKIIELSGDVVSNFESSIGGITHFFSLFSLICSSVSVTGVGQYLDQKTHLFIPMSVFPEFV